MKKIINFVLVGFLILLVYNVPATEYHVAKTGNNNNPGTAEKPFLSIQAAANVAQPGDVITVHAGVYRDRITPPRGGTSDDKRIVYRAAEGEKVEIKGSEIIKNWQRFKDDVWKVTIPNSFFGDYNPYKDLIAGDWFNPRGRVHHTGDVYLNGKSLYEAVSLDDVVNRIMAIDPEMVTQLTDTKGATYTWFCESDDANTIIYANFHGADPNKETIEINVRKTCFYPEKPGINYITVSGFTMRHAATQWAPPTAEQIGLIGTHWSKGWIIENNIISDSRCSGITLGKYGDEFDNKSANSAEGYVETIKRALTKGWNKENIGSHIIRNNTIHDCEQTGICGSLGAIFSTIENNNIYNIWRKRQFAGAEMAGIKIHASIDMLIKNNRLVNTGRGIWIDWMAQGARVTGNLCYNNNMQDLYSEVNHGPYLVDNNLFLSLCSVWDMSQGGAYVHNLMAGRLNMSPHSRKTPFHFPHSVEIAGYHELLGGDNRFINNVFLKECSLNIKQDNPEFNGRSRYGREDFGLNAYNGSALPVSAGGNVYFNGASPLEKETNHLEMNNVPSLFLEENDQGIFLTFDFDRKLIKMKNRVVTTKLLGKATVPGLAYTNPDGSDISIDKDYTGTVRNRKNPTPGPFEKSVAGITKLQVWPK
jgi:hypothetical protein